MIFRKKGEHLFQLFRPEFVKLNPVPLSSDAFSKFGIDPFAPEDNIHNKVNLFIFDEDITCCDIEIYKCQDRCTKEDSFSSICLLWQEVRKATERLLYQVIPSFAQYLDRRNKDNNNNTELSSSTSTISSENSSRILHTTEMILSDDTTVFTTEELSELVAEMHIRGINVRYLMRIYCHLVDGYAKRLILTEAVARTAKHLLEEK